MRFIAFIHFFLITFLAVGQLKPNNGAAESKPLYVALKHAEVYVEPGKKVKGTILIKDDKIEAVGPFVLIPTGAVEIDLSGKTVVPAFIDLHSDLGIPPLKYPNEGVSRPQYESSKGEGYYWNECVHPEVSASVLYKYDEKKAKIYTDAGFGFALVHQRDGIARGSGALVSLGDEDPLITLNQTTSFYSLNKGSSHQSYPSSQMGSIALLRQAFYDAKWYENNQEEQNITLAALNGLKSGIHFFETGDKWEILRVNKIAEEFELNSVFLGSGNEYEIVNHLKDLKKTIVIPLTFPKAYDVQNPYVARQIPLSELKHWEAAPANAAILAKNGVSFAITGQGLEKADEFWTNLRMAIEHGLSVEDALRALTETPAKILGVDKQIGSISEGKLASFVVYSKDPFAEKAEIESNWIKGDETRYIFRSEHKVDGSYNLSVEGYKFQIDIEPLEGDKYKGSINYEVVNNKGVSTQEKTDAKVVLNENDITIQFNVHTSDLNGNVSLQGKVSSKFGVFEGDGLLPNGEWVKWSGVKSVKSFFEPKKKEDSPKKADTSIRVWTPNMAYGFDTLPSKKPLVIKNATVWTNEADGIIEKGTVIVVDGKITYVGNGRHSAPAGARVIDAEGKFVTSGIIDEHSHIAISRGVNEGGQAISAEVSIGDVVNPDDINIYRQLSGGVTASQLLHGSANPIGGQSALIKLKWGSTPDEMLIDNAPKFIKFALGENVKQSNWGDYNTVRFPQTRMGVEQIYYDAFHRAQAYQREWEKFKSGECAEPRRDLELDVLSEILDHKRHISCHSYVQSEINMLMHVADSLGFKINTFTHILEGYKVADKMAAHGAGGSTFSDWWAYKFEVNDAIPYNAKLMHDQGVVVAINSDDAEMGRRLNQEAAKAVKYGGMDPMEAWKMVTLNPAKLLHLDDRMGSLKDGKDADIVIWSDNPLSVKAIVEYTIVDGVVLYDHKQNEIQQVKNQKDRARIINKMASDNKAGGEKRLFKKKAKGHYHCNTIGEEASTEENAH